MTNRLAAELSPYLQQHAHNPVDWYPWGEEALEKARDEDRPILLSIGYSACHWCHVMERESFDDPNIAAQMNASFVSIKVDREERPDLDKIYQTAVQLMTRRAGGWPLTVFLTPSLEPFYGGTYFPPTDRHGMPGFPRVLESVVEAYRIRRTQVASMATDVVEAIRAIEDSAPADEVGPDTLVQAARKLALRYDDRYGGFGDAPKFPNTLALDVMLRAYHATGESIWLDRVTQAVDAMIDGGIHDQLGGGFHRYATDARWRVPHFEKMLYDNALIARLLVDVWRVTKSTGVREACVSVLSYVDREMSDPRGGFFATQDADSDGREGAFFVWTPAELEAVLSPEDAALAARFFGVDDAGNFEDGTTVLHRARTVESLAKQLGEDESSVQARLTRARAQLLEARNQRPKPFRDEKIVTAWNGWMASAFAEAGGAFDEPQFVERAARALRYVRETSFDDGGLPRIAKDGRREGRAFLVDYAAIAGAALDLFEATFDASWEIWARTLAETALAKLWDPVAGLLYFAEASDDLVIRSEDNVDGEVPAGSSNMLEVLLRLDAIGPSTYTDVVERVLRRRAGAVLDNPAAFGRLTTVVDRWVNGPTHVMIVNPDRDDDVAALAEVVRSSFVPARVLTESSHATPAWLDPPPRRPGAYVCRGRTCSAPVLEADALETLLARS